MPIKNTEKDPKPHWLFEGNPGAIEAQEKRGQEEMTKQSFQEIAQLPAKGNRCDARGLYESLGIEIIGPSEGDDLFLDVRLPEGYKVVPTDHSMWSNLEDGNGAIKATIFYKAAFYDRDAFVNPSN